MRGVGKSIRWRAVSAGAAALTALAVMAVASATASRALNSPGEIELRFPGHDPSARWTPSGTLGMVFVREEGEGGRLYYADSAGRSPSPVSRAADRVVARPQTGPSLEVLPNGTMVVFYSVSEPAKHRTEIRSQGSTDGGATWRAPVVVNDDDADGPHGWLSSAVDSSGGAQVVWLDKRSGEQGLIWSRTTDGIHFERNRVLDPRVCFCCSTAVLTAPNGRAWFSYRDLEGKDLRNIGVIARGPDGSFSAPSVVSDDGWRIDGCPDSGPRMALASDGVWAVWFDGASSGVFSAFAPAGKRFSPRSRLAAHEPGGPVPNHPDIAVLPDGAVVALYVRGSTVFGRRLSGDEGPWTDAVALVEGAAEPRIQASGRGIALTFTGHDGGDLVAVAETRSLRKLVGGPK